MIYFASDLHLGVDLKKSSLEREKLFCDWLSSIASDATEIFLIGDLFDFWFEYSSVVPRGHVRLLGKLAELSDKGIPITVFIGNHDMWMFDYFEKELNIPVLRTPIRKEILGKQFIIGHGDGLGPGDKGYKVLKKIFANPVCQWLFARLHPNFGFGLARFWSARSREYTVEEKFLGPEKEWLVQYSESKIIQDPNLDFLVFGHRHLPIECILSNGKTKYINTGDWMFHFSYGVFDGNELKLEFYKNDRGTKIEVDLSKPS